MVFLIAYDHYSKHEIKRDKSECQAWIIGVGISADPSESILKRVIPFLNLAVVGERICSSKYSLVSSSVKFMVSVAVGSSVLSSIQKWRSRIQ